MRIHTVLLAAGFILVVAVPARATDLVVPGTGELAKLGPAGAILAAFVLATVALYRFVLAPSQAEAKATAQMQASTANALLETQKLQKARDDQASVQLSLMQGHNDALGKLISRLLDGLARFDRQEPVGGDR